MLEEEDEHNRSNAVHEALAGKLYYYITDIPLP